MYCHQGTHTLLAGALYQEQAWALSKNTSWYRSRDQVPVDHIFLGGGPLSSKQWPLNEEMSNHLLRFQQV